MKRTGRAERRKPGYNNEERVRAGMLWKGRAWRKGESTKWLTIFAEEMKLTEFFQARGRHTKKKKTSSVGGSRQLPQRGSQERGLSIKRLFEKMPECCSVAPHHLALQGASPQGEGLEID